MIKLTFTKTIGLDMECPNPELIVQSLKAIGFKDMGIKGDRIEFKSDIQDQDLGSFQRQYGNGTIAFKTFEKSVTITAITETKRNFTISLFFTFGLIISLVYFGLSNQLKISEVLMISSALFISLFLEYFIVRASIQHKQTELLNLLKENTKPSAKQHPM